MKGTCFIRYIFPLFIILIESSLVMRAQEKNSSLLSRVKGRLSTEIVVGSYTFKDGSIYTGELRGRKPYGYGKTVFPNGDVYEGDYVKGKREGHGTYTFHDGERYEGQWFQDQQHGRGIYHFINNNYFS